MRRKDVIASLLMEALESSLRGGSRSIRLLKGVRQGRHGVYRHVGRPRRR
jgi:hypothetical protein